MNAIMKSSSPKRRSHLESNIKGRRMESLFEKLTRELMAGGRLLPWIARLDRANPNEDLYEGTDFKIKAIKENGEGKSFFTIRIDVKSSEWQVGIFQSEHPDSRVHAIRIDWSTTLEDVRVMLDGIYLQVLPKPPPQTA
ncbi:MAG: hypothetical protein ABI430_01775 [Candidatus Taylorbacteria bacterium]